MSISEHENVHFDDGQNVHMGSENYEANSYRHDLDFASHSALNACSISYAKWV